MNNFEEKIKRIEDKYSKVFTKLLISAAISGVDSKEISFHLNALGYSL